jgi:hypothetical protein
MFSTTRRLFEDIQVFSYWENTTDQDPVDGA